MRQGRSRGEVEGLEEALGRDGYMLFRPEPGPTPGQRSQPRTVEEHSELSVLCQNLTNCHCHSHRSWTQSIIFEMVFLACVCVYSF